MSSLYSNIIYFLGSEAGFFLMFPSILDLIKLITVCSLMMGEK